VRTSPSVPVVYVRPSNGFSRRTSELFTMFVLVSDPDQRAGPDYEKTELNITALGQ